MRKLLILNILNLLSAANVYAQDELPLDSFTSTAIYTSGGFRFRQNNLKPSTKCVVQMSKYENFIEFSLTSDAYPYRQVFRVPKNAIPLTETSNLGVLNTYFESYTIAKTELSSSNMVLTKTLRSFSKNSNATEKVLTSQIEVSPDLKAIIRGSIEIENEMGVNGSFICLF